MVLTSLLTSCNTGGFTKGLMLLAPWFSRMKMKNWEWDFRLWAFLITPTDFEINTSPSVTEWLNVKKMVEKSSQRSQDMITVLSRALLFYFRTFLCPQLLKSLRIVSTVKPSGNCQSELPLKALRLQSSSIFLRCQDGFKKNVLLCVKQGWEGCKDKSDDMGIFLDLRSSCLNWCWSQRVIDTVYDSWNREKSSKTWFDSSI